MKEAQVEAQQCGNAVYRTASEYTLEQPAGLADGLAGYGGWRKGHKS